MRRSKRGKKELGERLRAYRKRYGKKEGKRIFSKIEGEEFNLFERGLKVHPRMGKSYHDAAAFTEKVTEHQDIYKVLKGMKGHVDRTVYNRLIMDPEFISDFIDIYKKNKSAAMGLLRHMKRSCLYIYNSHERSGSYLSTREDMMIDKEMAETIQDLHYRTKWLYKKYVEKGEKEMPLPWWGKEKKKRKRK